MCKSEGRWQRALREPAALELIGGPGQPTPDWLLIEQLADEPARAATWSLWLADWPLPRGYRVLMVLVAGKEGRS